MDDTLKILKMVEDGKITGEEASKLISALGKDKNDKKDEFFNIEKTNNGSKMLYIRVKSADGENVKVTIPIEVVKLAASLGNSTISGLEKYNIDFEKDNFKQKGNRYKRQKIFKIDNAKINLIENIYDLVYNSLDNKSLIDEYFEMLNIS